MDRLRRYTSAITEALQGIEAVLGHANQGKAEPYPRRRQLLQRIYEQQGLEKGPLIQAIREAGTTYQWIGQQVKKGYLEMPRPGEVKYRVTPRAVKEQKLTRIEKDETAVYASMAEESFAEDWNSPEDAVYDRL